MSGKGLGIGKIYIFPILVIIFFVTGYQEAYGTITSQLTIGDSGVPGTDSSHFNFLIGTTVDSSGNIYVVDEDNNRVVKFDSLGNYVSQIGCAGTNACVAGSGPNDLSAPAGVAVDSLGNIYVTDADNHRVQKFDSSGAYQSTIGVTGVPGSDNAHFNFPAGIALDSSGNIYVADSLNHRVQKFDSSGFYQQTIGVSAIPNSEYSGVVVDSSGNIYVTDSFNYRALKFNSAGINQLTIGVTGVSGSDNAHLSSPAGIALDSSGNIYVADSLNHRVQEFDPAGGYLTTIGETGVTGTDNSHFNFPTGLASDSSDNIYVGDSFNYRVQVFSASSISTGGGTGKLFHSDYPLPSMLIPSFGGVGNMVFADGLTLDGKVYSLGKFSQEIPKTIADVGQPVKIKIKEQLARGPSNWRYVAVYMNFEGKDPETYNAHLIMSIDKNEGQKLVDPKGYLKDYSVTTELDSTYVYTTFSFIAAKAMPDSTMIVSAWDDQARTNNVHVGGAIQFGDDPPVVKTNIPPGAIQFTDYYELKERIGKDGYDSPKILFHIHDTSDVLPDGDSVKVSWLYNPNVPQLTLIVSDKNDNKLVEQTQKLEKIIYSHIGYCNLPAFQGSCTSTPVYIDTPEGKAMIEKYQGKYSELLKSMGLLPFHY